MPFESRFISVTDHCSLRNIETPCVYNKATDELYELDNDSFEFLLRCDGTRTLAELGGNRDFVTCCIDEGILEALHESHPRSFRAGKAPDVSLRYLELHLTGRCNLRCRHCYLDPDGSDLELRDVFKAIEEFDEMQGLRLILSGGEPLLHKNFWYINERLQQFGFRPVLLTNGTLVNKDVASRLRVSEAQVSIDGMKDAHDALRGEGSFDLAVKAVEALSSAEIPASVATVATTLNRGDFDEMRSLVVSLGAKEWNVDAPSLSGRMLGEPGLMLSPEEAARCMSYGFGGGLHGGSSGMACGAHLCAVNSKGAVSKCGFYFDRPVGRISDGLRSCWEKVPRIRLDRLDCGCEFMEDCRGGCRFRAATYTNEYGPDPVRCHCYGVNPKGVKGGAVHDDQESG